MRFESPRHVVDLIRQIGLVKSREDGADVVLFRRLRARTSSRGCRGFGGGTTENFVSGIRSDEKSRGFRRDRACGSGRIGAADKEDRRTAAREEIIGVSRRDEAKAVERG